MSPSLLVTDPTDTIGRLTLHELVGRNVPVRVLARSEDVVRDHSSDLIQVVTGDPHDPVQLDAALTGISRVLLSVPPSPTSVHQQGTVIEAIERTGLPIHIFSVSPLGVVPLDAPLRIARWQAVTDAQLTSSGLPTTILRPHILMQTLLWTASSIQTDDMFCGSFGEARLPLVDGRDVARAAATLLTSEGPDEQTFVLTGPQALSFNQVARIFRRALGRPVRYVDMPIEMYHEYLVGSRIPSWIADDLTALARLVRRTDRWPITSDVARITGRPAKPLATFIRDHAAVFRPAGAGPSSANLPDPERIDFWSAVLFPPTGAPLRDAPATDRGSGPAPGTPRPDRPRGGPDKRMPKNGTP